MKKLAIIRHAHAEELQAGECDFDREITPEGAKDVTLISRQVKEKGIIPELIFTSPAERAIMTATIFAKQYKVSKSHLIAEKNFLYGYYGVENLKDILLEDAKTLNTVFLVGHNPTLSHLIRYLINNLDWHLPPGGVAFVEFDTDDWSEIDRTNSQLIFYECPPQKDSLPEDCDEKVSEE